MLTVYEMDTSYIPLEEGWWVLCIPFSYVVEVMSSNRIAEIMFYDTFINNYLPIPWNKSHEIIFLYCAAYMIRVHHVRFYNWTPLAELPVTRLPREATDYIVKLFK